MAGDQTINARIELTKEQGEPHAAQIQATLPEVFRYAYARLRSREEAEDVAMEVAERLLKEKDGQSLPYALRIARDRVIDRLRQQTRPGPKPPEETETSSQNPVVQDVHAVLDRLPENQAEALVLKYLHGLTTEEIAEHLAVTPAAANSLLQRARQSFRDLGKPEFPHLTNQAGEQQ